MMLDPWGYRVYSVRARDRQPLIEFMVDALHSSGCQVIHVPPADQAPFRITFETPEGERMGVLAYAFLANTRETRNRPPDEHRWQIKYGSRDAGLHDLWQDPYGVYTTLLLGINTDQGFFVAADPVLHSPTRMYISIEFKQAFVDAILRDGWATWERERRSHALHPIEVLVGGRPESFLDLIRLEREALGEDQGHRQLLAERSRRPTAAGSGGPVVVPPSDRIHALSRELELSEGEVMDLIARAPRLKMAVRGWVAEEHLYRQLQSVPGVSRCERLEVDGGADLVLGYRGRSLSIECKNVLRRTTRDGSPRVDFQRTRASIEDPCSRYYSPEDFEILAACLHAVTERWEFRFTATGRLDPHHRCPGKIANNITIDDRWSRNPTEALDWIIESNV